MSQNLFIHVRFDGILPCLKAGTRHQALQVLAREAAKHSSLEEAALLEKLVKNEETMSSGIGGSVALPHLMVENLDKPLAIFARADNKIDFESVDDKPVDILCLLISPQEDGPYHLRRLSRLSRLLRNASFCSRIREAHNEDTIRALLANTETQSMAA